MLDSIQDSIGRIESALAHLRREGPIATDDLSPEYLAYFHVKEQAARLRRLSQRVRGLASNTTAKPKARGRGRSMTSTQFSIRYVGTDDLWERIVTAPDITELVRGLAATSPIQGERIEDLVAETAREIAFLDLLGRTVTEQSGERVLVYPRLKNQWKELKRVASPASPSSGATTSFPGPISPSTRIDGLLNAFVSLYAGSLGLQASIVEAPAAPDQLPLRGVVVEGPGACELAKFERGTHLYYTAQEGITLVEIDAVRLPGDVSQADGLAQYQAARQSEVGVAAGSAGKDETAFADALPVIRVHLSDLGDSAIDLRSGFLTIKAPVPGELRAFVLSMLSLPSELEW